MRRAVSALAALLLAACASGQGGPPPSGADARRFTASPTVLVAASSRLSGAIRAMKGPGDIYEDYFTQDATILFDRPRSVTEAGLLREPLIERLAAGSIREALISCNGRTGITSGSLPADETTNAYDIVWRKDGKQEWRIVAVVGSQNDNVPDNGFIQSFTAGCDAPEDGPFATEADTGGMIAGKSADGTLRWQTRHADNAAPIFTLAAWDGDEWVTRD